MPKSKKALRETAPADSTQRLYARAYAARLAKQVANEVDRSGRRASASKRPAKK
jgi:hypothetical protein